MSLHTVVTTIQQPTECVVKLAHTVKKNNGKLIVVGDQNSPPDYDLDGADFYSVLEQKALSYRLAKKLPFNHYSRKNLGYLIAINTKASCIYETDDDNKPLQNWRLRAEYLKNVTKVGGERYLEENSRWINTYTYFSRERVWPRGFPLDEILKSWERREEQEFASETIKYSSEVRSPIQQGLVNNSPDVDAIWRLTNTGSFNFDEGISIFLSPGHWCPFNTQSTWWWPIAYPLLYVPSNCPFRMCDIWKSFIAQRCLWELDLGVTFHSAEVFQIRNEHDLMKDFEGEIEGYINNKKIIKTLESTDLSSSPNATGNNLYICYEKLVDNNILPAQELELVQCWLQDQ